MKQTIIICLLLGFKLDAHSHRHLNGTAQSAAGFSALVWNGIELAMHSAELMGLKPVCAHGCSHGHGSSLEKAYNVIELATHGLNLFETSAQFWDSFAEGVENYVPATVSSSSALLFNLGVVGYRILDSKKQFETIRSNPSRIRSYIFQTWSIVDMIGHLSSIYIAATGTEEH